MMEFYSSTKKNEILSFAGEGMELENIIVSEVSQVQKSKATCFLSCGLYKHSHSTKNSSCEGKVTYDRGRVKEGS
jgi:hypothetical protein